MAEYVKIPTVYPLTKWTVNDTVDNTDDLLAALGGDTFRRYESTDGEWTALVYSDGMAEEIAVIQVPHWASMWVGYNPQAIGITDRYLVVPDSGADSPVGYVTFDSVYSS